LVGLGLAQARPDLNVVVLDGDGAFILNPNQMLELGQQFPANLQIILLDNGAWGSTGSQPTLTARGLNLAAFGKSVGVTGWKRVVAPGELDGTPLIHFLIRAGNASVGTIPFKARQITARFQEAIRHG
jgi:sulfopyruvate decarboxylase subunit beta